MTNSVDSNCVGIQDSNDRKTNTTAFTNKTILKAMQLNGKNIGTLVSHWLQNLPHTE